MAAAATRVITICVSLAAAGVARAAEIRVYSTGAPLRAAKTIAVDFAKATGNRVTFTVGQPAIIEADLARGDKADVVILPAPVVANLTATGVLRADSAVEIARVGIGMVVRAGAKPPDITDTAALRRVLHDARSIVFPDPREPGGGSAGRAIARMIDNIGMTEVVRPKLTQASAIGGGVDLVARGKADVGIFNISEIMPVKGVTLVGPLPAELQSYIVFDAAIPKRNTATAPAAAFVKWLAAPAERDAWQKAGLEAVAAGQR